ncbi:MAG: AbrB/MazE/SpoVT family DNA-binding domain-containing protein [Methylococcaceae bacterium]|nr:AbrB/MazE/SpoVT family DNA-binding domain-containing protein [Methylococcaceae bacterium]
METTRLSSKGQVILPKSLRDAHHWLPGTEFEVEDRPDGVLLRPKKAFSSTQLSELIGCSGYSGPAKSLEDMEAAIAQGGSGLKFVPAI